MSYRSLQTESLTTHTANPKLPLPRSCVSGFGRAAMRGSGLTESWHSVCVRLLPRLVVELLPGRLWTPGTLSRCPVAIGTSAPSLDRTTRASARSSGEIGSSHQAADHSISRFAETATGSTSLNVPSCRDDARLGGPRRAVERSMWKGKQPVAWPWVTGREAKRCERLC
jgi:hypothetical protein